MGGLRPVLGSIIGAGTLLAGASVYACLRAGASPWLAAGFAAGAALGCAAAVDALVRRQIFDPLGRLGQAAALLPGGAEGSETALLERVAAAIETSSRAREGFQGEVSRLAERSADALARVQHEMGSLRDRVAEGRSASEAILASAGELNRALAQIRSNLDGIAGSTSDNSSSLIEMSSSIDQVATSSEQLSQHVNTTASAVVQMVQSIVEVADSVDVLARETEATAAAMVQIDASTRQIAHNAREATELSGRMADSAAEGSDAVQETLCGIHDSYGVIRETAGAMEELNDASRAIGGVVKIINEINDKTKLLSLNAAIIAAQAGDHGKSFAVVAHEIKNLSDRTSGSTGEISRIIENTRERMGAARAGVARGEKSMARSVELAERAGTILGRILSNAQVSHEMAGAILRATQEQAKGSHSVIASMDQVSDMVAHIRQAAQEHRSSGESVNRSTEVMRDLTEQVKLAVAEQANVGRYISDAIARIDRNMHDLLQAVARETQETENILTRAAEIREHSSGKERTLQAAAAAVAELSRQVSELRARAGAPERA